MKSQDARRAQIRELVRTECIKTQAEIVERLEQLGYSCTQATISRDIESLSLEKMPGGAYVLPEERRLQRFVDDFVVATVPVNNLCVVKTRPGNASSVSELFDSINVGGLVGTVAGDDTIMAIFYDDESAKKFAVILESFRTK